MPKLRSLVRVLVSFAIIVIIGATFAACAFGSSVFPLPLFDPDHVTAYRIELALSPNPSAAYLLREIADGPADLAKAKAAALADCIPLTVPSPPPANENAAPLYDRWNAICQKENLWGPGYSEPLTLRYRYTPPQLAAVPNMVMSVTKTDPRLLDAVKLPYCVTSSAGEEVPGAKGFVFNSQLDINLSEVVRQIRTAATLLALKGRWTGALAMQANALVVERQAMDQPTFEAFFFNYFNEAETIQGFESLMARSPDPAATAKLVSHALKSAEGDLSLEKAMRGDGAYTLVLMESYRTKRLAGADAPGRNFINQQVDAMEANYLNQQRAVVDVLAEPRLQRDAALRQLIKKFSYLDDPRNPAGGEIINHFIPDSDDCIVAQQQVALAASAMLMAKAKTGTFPPALPPGYIDPFNGKPLVYRREGSGFMVYSVGSAGTFDGDFKKGADWAEKAGFQYPPPAGTRAKNRL